MVTMVDMNSQAERRGLSRNLAFLAGRSPLQNLVDEDQVGVSRLSGRNTRGHQHEVPDLQPFAGHKGIDGIADALVSACRPLDDNGLDSPNNRHLRLRSLVISGAKDLSARPEFAYEAGRLTARCIGDDGRGLG